MAASDMKIPAQYFHVDQQNKEKQILDSEEGTDPILESFLNLFRKQKELKEMYLSQKQMELKLGIDIQTLEESKRNLTSDTELLNRQKVELGTDLDSMRVETAMLNKEKSKLERDIESFNKEKTKYESDIESLKKEKTELGSEIVSLNNEKINLRAATELLNREKTTLSVEKTQLVSDICLLNERKNVLESDIDSYGMKKSELGKELQLLSKKKEKLQSDLESLMKEMSMVGSIQNKTIQQPKPIIGQGGILGNLPTRVAFDLNFPSYDRLSFQESHEQRREDSRSVTVSEGANTCLNKEDIGYSHMPHSTGRKRQYYQAINETHTYWLNFHWDKLNSVQMYPKVFKEKDLLLDTLTVLYPHQKKRRTQKGRRPVTSGTASSRKGCKNYEKQARGWGQTCQNFNYFASSPLKDVLPSIQINETSGSNILNGQSNVVGGHFGNLHSSPSMLNFGQTGRSRNSEENAILNKERLKRGRDIESLNKENIKLSSDNELFNKEKEKLRSDFEILNIEKTTVESDLMLRYKQMKKVGSDSGILCKEKT